MEAFDGDESEQVCAGVDSSPLHFVKAADAAVATAATASIDRELLPRDLLPWPLDPLRESCDFSDL